MIIDLNSAFPETPDGSPRGPLPKQKLFLELALAQGSPKYIRYLGGIGSGKTLIGCITILTWAVLYPGDYLISRQFYPELITTTYKTFLEICPPELIVEHKVAERWVKVRAAGGQLSNIFFRPLEEPDKLRSLNLSGFYIDEASQVSEAAFMLLQGRLRGKGLRKGILTTNSSGHDWGYKWFNKKDHLKTDSIKAQFVNIVAPSTENRHLPAEYVQTLLESWSEERIRREIYADEDQFEGQIYSEFRRVVHVIKPFAIPASWKRVVGADHGYRNPTAWLWGAVDYDGNLYLYREFYQREWLIEEIVKGKGTEPGVLTLMRIPGTNPPRYEQIEWAKIDPSTRAARNEVGGRKISDFELYVENLPSDFPLSPANNDVTAGIDKVKSYLKINPHTGKPRMYIFDTLTNTIDELENYRYQQLTVAQQGRKNEKETPVKNNDHAMDALKYMVLGLPEAPIAMENVWEKIKYNSLEGALFRDLQSIKNPSNNKDPFGI